MAEETSFDYRGYSIHKTAIKTSMGARNKQSSTVSPIASHYYRYEILKDGEKVESASSADDAKAKIDEILEKKK